MAKDQARVNRGIRNQAMGEMSEAVVRNRLVCLGMKGIGKAKDSDPPAGFDWDLWQGPARRRPYNKLRCPFKFRYFCDLNAARRGTKDYYPKWEPKPGVAGASG